jgi:diguanylate cyclase (GGDEF)-like protein/PAS domain S-box-containing protein
MLSRMEAEFRLLAENSSDMVERFDVNDIRRYVSPASRSVLGIDAAELLGATLFEMVHPDDLDYMIEASRRLRGGLTSQTITFRAYHKSGREIWLESNLSALPRSGDGKWAGSVAVTRDVTKRKDLEVRLAEMATVDGLTGLSNRHAFDDRFAAELRRAQREKTALSVLMIDADHFKHFNDTYGHIAGDNCLRSISATIAGATKRPSDMVARFGGEEIVVLLPNTDQPGAYALARRICRQIRALGIPHEKNAPWKVVTVSMGVATFSGNETAEYLETDLLEAADRAMYQAKATGRNCVVAAGDRSQKLALVAG